jgi:hypothetical protein
MAGARWCGEDLTLRAFMYLAHALKEDQSPLEKRETGGQHRFRVGSRGQGLQGLHHL